MVEESPGLFLLTAAVGLSALAAAGCGRGDSNVADAGDLPVKQPPRRCAHSRPVGFLASSPTEPMLVSCAEDGARVWNLAAKSLVRAISDSEFGAAAFSPDGRILALRPLNEPVQLRNASTLTRLEPPGEFSAIHLAFSADSRELLTLDHTSAGCVVHWAKTGVGAVPG